MGCPDKFYSNTLFAEGFASSKPAPEILERRIRIIPGVQDVRLRIVHESVIDFPEEDLPLRESLFLLPKE